MKYAQIGRRNNRKIRKFPNFKNRRKHLAGQSKLLRLFFFRNGGVRSDRCGAVWAGRCWLITYGGNTKRCGSCQAGFRAINRMKRGYSIPVLRSICILFRIYPAWIALFCILWHFSRVLCCDRSNVPRNTQNAANRTVDTLELMCLFSIRFCRSGLVCWNRSVIIHIDF